MIRLLSDAPSHRTKYDRAFRLRPINTTQGTKGYSPNSSTTYNSRDLTESKAKKVPQKKIKGNKRELMNVTDARTQMIKKVKEKKHLAKSKENVLRSQLNKLYGYNKRFINSNFQLKKKRELSLDNYQQKILKVSSYNLSKDNKC